jgi:acetate kinase
MFNYRIKKYSGSYAAAMGGVDTLIFNGGIGENEKRMRQGVCEGLEFLGIEIDKEVNNKTRGEEVIISKPGSKVKIMVVPTNEELVIAQDTKTIVEKL